MPPAAATEQPLLSAFEVAADILRGMLEAEHAHLGELRTKAHRYGLKAWVGGPAANAPKEHYEAQVVGPAHVPDAKVLAIEVGLHLEDKDEAKNDATLDRLLAREKAWRKELGGPDEVHAFAPNRAARARRPLHRRRVDGDALGEIAVDRLR